MKLLISSKPRITERASSALFERVCPREFQITTRPMPRWVFGGPPGPFGEGAEAETACGSAVEMRAAYHDDAVSYFGGRKVFLIYDEGVRG